MYTFRIILPSLMTKWSMLAHMINQWKKIVSDLFLPYFVCLTYAKTIILNKIRPLGIHTCIIRNLLVTVVPKVIQARPEHIPRSLACLNRNRTYWNTRHMLLQHRILLLFDFELSKTKTLNTFDKQQMLSTESFQNPRYTKICQNMTFVIVRVCICASWICTFLKICRTYDTVINCSVLLLLLFFCRFKVQAITMMRTWYNIHKNAYISKQKLVFL